MHVPQPNAPGAPELRHSRTPLSGQWEPQGPHQKRASEVAGDGHVFPKRGDYAPTGTRHTFVRCSPYSGRDSTPAAPRGLQGSVPSTPRPPLAQLSTQGTGMGSAVWGRGRAEVPDDPRLRLTAPLPLMPLLRRLEGMLGRPALPQGRIDKGGGLCVFK